MKKMNQNAEMQELNERIKAKYSQPTPQWFLEKAKVSGKEDKPLESVNAVMRFNYLRSKYLPGYTLPCTEASLDVLEEMDD